MKYINYDQKKHIELLKRDKNYLNQGTHFSLKDRDAFLELLGYSRLVQNHVFWQDRFETKSIMEAFLNKEMDAHQFHDAVFELRNKQIRKYKKILSDLEKGELKNFSPDENGEKLDGFLSGLYLECENFEMNFDAEELYNSIEIGFSKFQEVLREE